MSIHFSSKISRPMAAIGILLGIGTLSATWFSINMSLASIQTELFASLNELQWMMNCYGIGICLALLIMNKLGDSYGRKLFYMLGLGGLALACIGAGFAQSIYLVIASMGLFGVSGGALLALSQSLLVRQFPENQKSKAIALWLTVTSITSCAGPLAGGFIGSYLSWRWVFFINIPLIVIALMLVHAFVEKEKTTTRYFDWGGVVLLSLLVGCCLSGITQGPYLGWNSEGVVGFFRFAFGCLIGLVVLERKSQEPIFSSKLFANPGFLFSSICNGLLMGFIWAVFFYLPLYLQNQMQFSLIKSGLIMTLITLPVASLSFPMSKLCDRWGAKPLLFIGFVLLAAVVYFQSFLTVYGSCTLIGIGWALVRGPLALQGFSVLPKKMAETAFGMYMTLQQIGGVIGLAMAGVAFNVGYQTFLVFLASLAILAASCSLLIPKSTSKEEL